MVIRAWLTDGSLPVFSDTYRLDATHPALPGIRTRYEGLIDDAVPRGAATVDGESPDDRLFLEAEWVVELPGGIAAHLEDPAGIGADTPVVLQGMIEGKWLNRLLETRAWRPASVGNNLVAAGPGIPTTLGAIGREDLGAMRIAYRDEQGSRRLQTTSTTDLRYQNVLGLVRAVARLCAEAGLSVDAVDLGASGEQAAIVNERARMRASIRPLSSTHAAKERLVRRVLAERLGLPPGGVATMVVTDRRGEEVGRGELARRAVSLH